MSLNKAIEHGKEHRKQYRGARYYLSSCRNHGSDPLYQSQRMHKIRKRMEAMKSREEELG